MNSVSTLAASCSGLAVSPVGLAFARRESPSPQQPILHRSTATHSRSVSAPLLKQRQRTSRTSSLDHQSDTSTSFPTPIRYHSLSELNSAMPMHVSEYPSITPHPDMLHPTALTSRGGNEDLVRSGSIQGNGFVKHDSHTLVPDHSLKGSVPWATDRPSRGPVEISQSSSVISERRRLAVLSAQPRNPVLNQSTQIVETSSPELDGNTSGKRSAHSRLPLPIFRTPSTSQRRHTRAISEGLGVPQQAPISIKESPILNVASKGEQIRWRNLFNPIKRVYPDPRHHPVLVSVPSAIETHHATEIDSTVQVPVATSGGVFGRRAASSPYHSLRPVPSGSASSLSPRPQAIMSRKGPRRRHSQQIPAKSAIMNIEVDSRPVESAQRHKRSSTSSLQPICHNRVKSSAPLLHGLKSDVQNRNFSSPTASSRNRISATLHGLAVPLPRQLRVAGRRSINQAASVESTPSTHQVSSSSSAEHLQDLSSMSLATDSAEQARGASVILTSCTVDENASDFGDYTVLSETASSAGGSYLDNASRDDDFEFTSNDDAMYDSVRTRATSTSSALREPSMEKLFIPPQHDVEDACSKESSANKWAAEMTRHSIIEEEESNASTPVRRQRCDLFSNNDSCLTLCEPRVAFPSLARDTFAPIDDAHSVGSVFGLLDILETSFVSTSDKVSLEFDQESHANGEKGNIFDWSEQGPLDLGTDTEIARPKTVHGKKPLEARNGRSSGRRVTIGLHARSHSVPVAHDVDGKRTQIANNKFGTWGVGGKGVTEDWNEDFDIEEEPALSSLGPIDAKIEPDRVDRAKVMIIPTSIREQQSSILANIGLLRDWGLLIEELKELKARASTITMLRGQGTMMWNEVDAMIDLADHESNDHTLAADKSIPSSPDFNADAFDDPPVGLPRAAAGDVVDSPSSSPVKTAMRISGRPRKDSEAVARSVIEALQQKRNVPDATSTDGSSVRPSKKVPFDTATLRRIVPHVQELRDQVKQAIREAEGLYDSPRLQQGSFEDGPLFSRIFQPALAEVKESNARRSLAAAEATVLDDKESKKLCSTPEELETRFNMTTVV